MKKNFFYLALAALVAVGMPACSSDDDDEVVELDPINLPTPPNAANAVEYVLPIPLDAKTSSVGDPQTAPALKSINFTESGKILLELVLPVDEKTDKHIYVMEDATFSNNTYTMNGKKVRGTIRLTDAAARTRANSHITVDIAVTITFEDNDGENVEETITYASDGEVTTETNKHNASGDEVMERLVRTWSVLGAILDLKSDSKNVKAYEEFDSNSQGYFDLRDVRAEAINQEVKMTENEKAEFERTVKSVTITADQKFIIDYTDHDPDVAQWEWNNPDKTSIRIILKEGCEGNKFFSNNTKIAIAFNGNRCNLKMQTDVSDAESNDWEVELTLKLIY